MLDLINDSSKDHLVKALQAPVEPAHRDRNQSRSLGRLAGWVTAATGPGQRFWTPQ